MLECFLYTSYSSKDQNSEANKKRRERRPTDRISMDANATALHQQALLPSLQKDAGATTAHRGSSTAAAASLTGTYLFPLEGKYPI